MSVGLVQSDMGVLKVRIWYRYASVAWGTLSLYSFGNGVGVGTWLILLSVYAVWSKVRNLGCVVDGGEVPKVNMAN